jgi:hypothetical protein
MHTGNRNFENDSIRKHLFSSQTMYVTKTHQR